MGFILHSCHDGVYATNVMAVAAVFVQRECGSQVVLVGQGFCPNSQENPMKGDLGVSLPPGSASQASLSSRLPPLAAATDTNTSQAAPLLKTNWKGYPQQSALVGGDSAVA